MKILLVNSLYHPHETGGAERVARDFAEAFAARGHSVVVACLTPSCRREETRVGAVRVVRLPLANLYWPFDARTRRPVWQRAAWHLLDDWNPIMARRLGAVMDEERPQLVNLHNLAGFSAAAYGAAAARGLPVVQTLHDYYFVCPRSTMFRDGRNCARPCATCHALTRVRRRTSQRADLVIGVSGALLRELEAQGAFHRGRRRMVLHNPYEPPMAPVTQWEDRPPRAPLRLGFIGRLAPTKGIETLLAALRQLGDLPVSALVAGSGAAGYEATLRRESQGLPVDFLGHVTPDELFARIDLLVVPSAWREPFPRVVQEALGRGVPVLGAASGGIPEQLGAAAADRLFRPQNSGALAGLVRRLVEQGFPARAWSEACLARSRDFAPTPILDTLLARFEELTSG